MAVLLPIGGHEKDVLVDYDLAIVDFVPSNRLRKPIFDADVAGVLKRLGYWNDGLENNGEAARPLQGKDVSPCDTCRLWFRQREASLQTNIDNSQSAPLGEIEERPLRCGGDVRVRRAKMGKNQQIWGRTKTWAS